jgi:CheY-like chemotaxis protein
MTVPIRVLMVEDNPGDADLTRETLEAGKIHVEISVAIDGVEALAILRRSPPYTNAPRPDLILLDINLPKLDGREVLAAIKSDASLSQIPIVVLTSSDAEQDVVRCYGMGANCYVTKPVGLVAFQAIVQSIENFWFMVAKLP